MENKTELSKHSLLMIESFRNNLKYNRTNNNTGLIKLFENIFKVIDNGKIKELKTLIERHFRDDINDPCRIPNLKDSHNEEKF
jgi:hypothetical protein